jgi:hypothetical protein
MPELKNPHTLPDLIYPMDKWDSSQNEWKQKKKKERKKTVKTMLIKTCMRQNSTFWAYSVIWRPCNCSDNVYWLNTRGGNNHSPTRQMRVEFGIGEYFFKPTRQLGEYLFLLSVSLFSPLIEPYSSTIMKYKHLTRWFIYYYDTQSWWSTFWVGLVQSAHCTNAQQRHDFGEFSSALASKNFELLASLASALKILIPPLWTHINTCIPAMCVLTSKNSTCIVMIMSPEHILDISVFLPNFIQLCGNIFQRGNAN